MAQEIHDTSTAASWDCRGSCSVHKRLLSILPQAAERGAMRLKSLSESKEFSLKGDFLFNYSVSSVRHANISTHGHSQCHVNVSTHGHFQCNH